MSEIRKTFKVKIFCDECGEELDFDYSESEEFVEDFRMSVKQCDCCSDKINELEKDVEYYKKSIEKLSDDMEDYVALSKEVEELRNMLEAMA